MGGDTGAFAYQEDFVGETLGIGELGIAAQANEPFAKCGLILADDPPRRMVLVRQFDRSVGKCTARSASLSLKSQTWRSQASSWPFGSPACAAAIASQATSNSCVSSLQACGDQHILRGEVPIERHLVGAGRLGDRVDADRMDAAAIEQLARGREDALARRQAGALPIGGRSSRLARLMSAPSLDMLLTGQYVGCYRSVPINLARVQADFHPCVERAPPWITVS